MVTNVGANVRDFLKANWNSATFPEPLVTLGGDMEDCLDSPKNNINIMDFPTNFSLRHSMETHILEIYGHVVRTSIIAGQSDLFTTQYPVMLTELLRVLRAGQNSYGTLDSWIDGGDVDSDIVDLPEFGGALTFLITVQITVI